jgi:hypothetical protein
MKNNIKNNMKKQKINNNENNTIRSKQVNFRVSQKIYDAVNRRASELGKSRSLYLNDIIVADLELSGSQPASSYDIQMIMQRLDDIEELLSK